MGRYRIVRSDQEIERVLDWVAEGINDGSHYPGMSYEDGIAALFNWLTEEDWEGAPDE